MEWVLIVQSKRKLIDPTFMYDIAFDIVLERFLIKLINVSFIIEELY